VDGIEQQAHLLGLHDGREFRAFDEQGGAFRDDLLDDEPVKGLRDRAAIAINGYTFGRRSAVVGVKLGDYRLEGKGARLRLMEKGNKEKLVRLHREAEEHLAAYLAAAHIEDAAMSIFRRSTRRTG
jgi:site-specific recombinase XerD